MEKLLGTLLNDYNFRAFLIEWSRSISGFDICCGIKKSTEGDIEKYKDALTIQNLIVDKYPEYVKVIKEQQKIMEEGET